MDFYSWKLWFNWQLENWQPTPLFTTTSQYVLFFTIVCFRDWEEQREQLMASLRGREDFDAVNTKEYFRWQKFSEIFRNQNFRRQIFEYLSNAFSGKVLTPRSSFGTGRMKCFLWKVIDIRSIGDWFYTLRILHHLIICNLSSVQIISDHNRIHPTFLIMNEYSMMFQFWICWMFYNGLWTFGVKLFVQLPELTQS